MKILPLIVLALLVFFPASSYADNNYKVLGNHKEMYWEVDQIDENSVGLTKEDLDRTFKLRLMKNGVKPMPIFEVGKHYLDLDVNIIDIRGRVAASISIELNKFSSEYVSPDHGASDYHIPFAFVSAVHVGIVVTSTKSGVLETVEQKLDYFILK